MRGNAVQGRCTAESVVKVGPGRTGYPPSFPDRAEHGRLWVQEPGMGYNLQASSPAAIQVQAIIYRLAAPTDNSAQPWPVSCWGTQTFEKAAWTREITPTPFLVFCGASSRTSSERLGGCCQCHHRFTHVSNDLCSRWNGNHTTAASERCTSVLPAALSQRKLNTEWGGLPRTDQYHYGAVPTRKAVRTLPFGRPFSLSASPACLPLWIWISD